MDAKEVIQRSMGSRGYFMIVGKERQEQMSRNGWKYHTPGSGENLEDVVQGYLDKNYDVKIYKSTTYVRGYHKTFIVYRRKNYLW